MVSQGNQVQNQVQNQISINVPSHGQGKHINKGRWTKEEVRLLLFKKNRIKSLYCNKYNFYWYFFKILALI